MHNRTCALIRVGMHFTVRDTHFYVLLYYSHKYVYELYCVLRIYHVYYLVAINGWLIQCHFCYDLLFDRSY